MAYRTPGDAAGDATDAGHQRWRRIADELGFAPVVGDRALETYLATLAPSRAHWDLTEGLDELATDVLLVASVDDELFDIDSARALAAHHPRSALVELAGLDHRASARAAPAVDAIVEFVGHTHPSDGSH